MTNPDIIVSWPVHLDYPLWRQFIHDNRSRFENVIVVFTQMNAGRDYRPWLKEQLSKEGIICMDNNVIEANQDWRDVAINKGLGESHTKWIFFTEQDFFPQEGFWDVVDTLSKSTDVVGYFQEGRLHPCCIFIKRKLLNTTSRYFGVVKDKLDHFGQIQKELDEKNIPIGIISPYYGYHLNGLSQNMFLLQIGEKPNYEPEKFKEYCQKCLQIDLPIHPEIKKLMEEYLK